MYQGEPKLLPGVRQRGRVAAHALFGDAKVDDFDRIVPVGALCQKQIGGLDVTVNEPRRVGFRQTFTNLQHDRNRFGLR
jgi:hypothetical protein